MAPISMHHLYFTAPTEATTPTSECDDNGNLSVRTPYPMNIDGSATNDFSARAYAVRGTLTPVQSTRPPRRGPFHCYGPLSDASTGATSAAPPSPPAEKHRHTQLIDPGVVPLPSVAPFVSALVPTHPTVATSPSAHAASPSVSSSSGSGSVSSPSTASTMTTPPSSPASVKSPSGFARWSATGRASLDVPPTYQFAPMAQPEAPPTPKCRASLRRTLRGEAKLLSGKMRRDPARVEAGRRMMGGA
ncbi:hypothetical protein FB451DRAFT_1482862 [Mycena latifolia]|nr:hypothetical protein FB451DRAFT_1482862 [Mycena latifolia]